MRVLKVVQSYFPFQDRGGPVVKVRALARGLARRGHDVTILTADLGFPLSNGSATTVQTSPWGWEAEEDGVEAIYLKTAWTYRALTLNPRVIGFCRAALPNFNVVHIYGLYDMLGPAVSHFCRTNRIPYLVEPMGMYRPIVRSIRMKRIYHGLLGRPLIGGARFLIATSESEKREILEGGIAGSRVVVRRNGIEVPDRIPEPGGFRRAYGIAPDARVALFLGRIVSKKSPDMLLEAYSRWLKDSPVAPDSRVVISGPDEEDGYLSLLKSLAEKLGIRARAIFPGPLYDDAKWSAYRDADVFVLPSQSENFGNTAAEAAVCGTPVIVTDRCGIASYLGTAGLVIHHDAAELHGALKTAFSGSDFRGRCRSGCAELAQKLSWEEPLGQMEEVYSRCAGERRPS